MKLLRQEFDAVPAVFYSRKATVSDVKLALEAGALDVLQKPHPSLGNSEAARLADLLARYCEGEAPNWRRNPQR